jgi:hypothetical protein
VGYGSAPVLIRPMDGYACWEVRSPLQTFPSQGNDPTEIHPDDCIFSSQRTHRWLSSRFGDRMAGLYVGHDKKCPPDMKFTVIEYFDADEWVTVVLGKDTDDAMYGPALPGARFIELERFPNRIGVCPAVVPGRITLDRRAGQFDGMLGMYQMMAKLTALSYIATHKGILRDEWLVAHPNEEPQIVAVPDAFEGRPGIVKGGSLVPRDVDPQFQTSQMADRLERSIREEGGVPSEFGGSSSSGTRTARRGAQLLSAVVDFPVAEAQEMLASSLEVESELVIETEKAYFGSMPRSFHVGWKGAKGPVDFTPAEMWADLTRVEITYAFAGMDTNSLVIEAGQRLGQGTMDRQTFMEIDPFISDVEQVKDRIKAERLEDAGLSAIQTLAANPEGPWQPPDFARLTELIVTNRMEWFEAVNTVQTEAQERQAAQAPPDDPSAMPGVATPGMGVEVPPSIQGPSDDMGNLNSLLMSLRGPTMTTPAETAVPV